MSYLFAFDNAKVQLYFGLCKIKVDNSESFYPASEYHQDYLDKNKDGYCHLPLELFEWAKQQKMNKR